MVRNLVYSILSNTLTRVDFTIEQQRDTVFLLFGFLYFVFYGVAPIHYVQAAILNLLYANLKPYLLIFLKTGQELLLHVGYESHLPILLLHLTHLIATFSSFTDQL